MEKRLDLKVGYSCNNNCWFCAQGAKKLLGDKSLDEIKRDLELSRKNGCEAVVFTGGEPTIRKDLLECIRHAKSLGYKYIQLQTNGRMFYYKKFCRDVIEAGANDFGIALHGDIPEVHDYLVGAPGAFEQVVQGIKNLRELNQTICSNTVIVKANYSRAPQIAKLLVELGVSQYQLAFVHAVASASENFDSQIPLKTLAVPYIIQALQIGIDNNCHVMVEAVPPCLLPGYEKYASENFIPQSEVREKTFFISDFDKVRKNQLKAKFPQCAECIYDKTCEGPWKEYPAHFGTEEFQPVRRPPQAKIDPRQQQI